MFAWWFRRLFADDDLPAGANVLTRLRGAFVLSGLKPDDGLAGLQRLLGEIALSLFRRFWSQIRSGPFRVSVSLYIRATQTSRENRVKIQASTRTLYNMYKLPTAFVHRWRPWEYSCRAIMEKLYISQKASEAPERISILFYGQIIIKPPWNWTQGTCIKSSYIAPIRSSWRPSGSSFRCYYLLLLVVRRKISKNSAKIWECEIGVFFYENYNKTLHFVK